MRSLLPALLSNTLSLMLLISVASSFCADNTTASHESSTEETPKYTNKLCFDLVSPAIKRLMQDNHDDFPHAFRDNNKLWNSIGNITALAADNSMQPHGGIQRRMLTLCNAIKNYNNSGTNIAQLINTLEISKENLIDLGAYPLYDDGNYGCPLYMSTLRFVHTQDSQSKSIITTLIRTGVPLDSMEQGIFDSYHYRHLLFYHPHRTSKYTKRNYLDLLTHKELRLLVKEECYYIENAYLTLKARSTKEKATLPAELLIKIMNYVVGTEFDLEVYGKIIDNKIQSTDENTNLGMHIGNCNIV